LRWNTTPADLGSHAVVLRAEDPYGAYVDQEYILNVVDTANRPPRFVSDPIVDAYVGIPYLYQLAAVDPDVDPLTYSLSLNPEGMSVADAARGLVRWTPPAELVGQTVLVKAVVVDGVGGEAMQEFQVYVHQTQFILPTVPTNAAVGNVDPGVIEVALDAGDVITQSVSITLPENTSLVTDVDVFLLFDDTGSFESVAPSG
jgi:hypothetical protein